MPKVHVPLSMQRAVIQRAKGYCEYCQLPVAFSPASFNFEHIIPLIKQGLTILLNLAFSCGGCNAHKKDKTEALDPLTRQIMHLFNPRTDIWQNFIHRLCKILKTGKTLRGYDRFQNFPFLSTNCHASLVQTLCSPSLTVLHLLLTFALPFSKGKAQSY